MRTQTDTEREGDVSIATVHHGEALDILTDMPTGTVDAVITDPPYSSGGMMRGDRAQSTRVKYTTGKQNLPSSLEFAGDNRDQRGWMLWMSLWLTESLRVTKPGGALIMFCDWRQLPTATDAIQIGGWVWRGIVPWHKPNGRRQPGRFANNCEYVVWGTAGPRPADTIDGALNGFFQVNAPHVKDHITQKPIEIMRELVRVCPPGGLILDPFAGSGQTGVASILEGRQFVGVELTEHYHQIAEQRLRETQQGYREDPQQPPLQLLTQPEAP